MHYKEKVKQLVINTSMRLGEILKENAGHGFTAKVKDATYHRDEWDPEDPYADSYDYQDVELDIYYDGVRIGNVSTGVFGGLSGTVGRRGISLDDIYKIKPEEDDSDNIDHAAWEEYATKLITRYFTDWKSGRKHFELVARQFGLEALEEEQERCVTCDGTGKQLVGDDLLVFDCPDCKDEELEERKVTKTVAGSKQPPSRKLAMALKKKSPKQGKKPVEIDKMPRAKDLANITLKGEYNQYTK